MTFAIKATADEELAEAFDHYAGVDWDLGQDFLAEYQRALEFVLRHPEAMAPFQRHYRRKGLQRFPYNLIYEIRGETLIVHSVFHQHRDPESWKSE